ncbi:winged helix-turn-helix domain-containing protein [Lysinibacillus sp. RSDA_15]|uniref:winged helix-turn-helix domain-containing protein n=1 Tax=Lysinibacillus sp. RSDA_15 TaxID=3391421 RepID=UPI003A4D6283
MENYLQFNPQTNEALIFNYDGEILSKGRFISEEEIERAQKQRECYKKKLASEISLEYGKLNRHVGCFQRRITNIVPNLSLSECGFLITILAKMKLGGDGFLINNNKRMTVDDISEYVDLSRQQASKHLNKFTELGILEKIKDGRKRHYRVNPQFHIMGEHDNNTNGTWFIRLYKTKLYEMIENLTLPELGFIYKALPICHYSTFELVHNPNAHYNPTAEEGSEEASFNVDLELFNRSELGQYMDEDVDNITKIANSLSKKGLLMTNTAHGRTCYTLHPHIVHPKGLKISDYIQGICNKFETHRKDALRRKGKGRKA